MSSGGFRRGPPARRASPPSPLLAALCRRDWPPVGSSRLSSPGSCPLLCLLVRSASSRRLSFDPGEGRGRRPPDGGAAVAAPPPPDPEAAAAGAFPPRGGGPPLRGGSGRETARVRRRHLDPRRRTAGLHSLSGAPRSWQEQEEGERYGDADAEGGDGEQR